MRIEFENIVLRDMIESDIEDYVRWFTVEREWENWDAPWEKEDTNAEAERKSWTERYESRKNLLDDVRRYRLEIEWKNGIGTNALRAFINYQLTIGADEIYTQTWSGNVRMIRCAEKLGFVECNRNIGTREVDGQCYDGLTFRLEE